mmetsp:Transcript_36689/g.35467  ORF Transcript_36689/g.35467 Transcript_36689/m.35467 type:complete len:84 (-) Transcript_36689:70-321(-)
MGINYQDERVQTRNLINVNRRNPVKLRCLNCLKDVRTKVEHSPGPVAWGACLVIGCLGCPELSWVPFCCPRCYDQRHRCHYCN